MVAPNTIEIPSSGSIPAGGSSLLYEQVEVNSGVTFSTASASYVNLTGATFNVTLTNNQVVYVFGEAYALRDDAHGGKLSCQLGVNVGGLDYNGTSCDTATLGEFVSTGVVVGRAFQLATGTTTIQLRLRTSVNGDAAVNAIVATTTANPVRLTVIYGGDGGDVVTNPEAATFVVHPTAGAGDYTTIQAALTALVPLGGGYVLAREGTYAENLVFPDVPVVLRGCGDITKVNLAAAAGSAFSVSVNQEITIEDIQVTGDNTAAQFVLDIPASVTGTKKITLNRVNSYDSVKTIVRNSGVTTPLMEIKTSAVRGSTAGWTSAGAGTLILTDLAGSFGAVTGATTGTLITRNTLVGAVAILEGGVVESMTYPATTPAQITSNQNNYAIGTGTFFRLTTDAQRDVTGIAGGWNGRKLVLTNRGSFNIVLKASSGSSAAANQIVTQTGTDIVMTPNGAATLMYDATSTKWLEIA